MLQREQNSFSTGSRVYRFKGQNIIEKRPGNKVLLADQMKCNTSTPGVTLELLPSIALSSTQATRYFKHEFQAKMGLVFSETVDIIKTDTSHFFSILNFAPGIGNHFRQTPESRRITSDQPKVKYNRK
jgi:hypothetical protein